MIIIVIDNGIQKRNICHGQCQVTAKVEVNRFPYIKDYKINKTISNKSVEYRSPIQNSPLPLA